MSCLNCGCETANPKYCSRSCAASANNRASPKRKRGKTLCRDCQTPIESGFTFCKSCFISKTVDYSLEEVQYDAHHKSSAWALVRARARTATRALPRVCISCGYDRHVEVCHKTPIKAFSLQAKISEVNHPDNLILLCPNCHWEFDNGMLNL